MPETVASVVAELEVCVAEPRRGETISIPAVTVTDEPRFGWRGLMVDTARHFMPLSTLTLIVDQMASVKLNVLHLHLTDDQGWRIEIVATDPERYFVPGEFENPDNPEAQLASGHREDIVAADRAEKKKGGRSTLRQGPRAPGRKGNPAI